MDMGRKILVMIGDGMSDEPIESLGGKTPLEAVEAPAMDSMAAGGLLGQTCNVPDGCEPGSDVAIMSILGYDPAQCYSGRGPLEAASIGVTIPDGFFAFRCNLINTQGSDLIDYSAGHITTEEAAQIIATLKEHLDVPGEVEFYPGVSFRHLLLIRGDFSQVRTHPPHDNMDNPWEPLLPNGPDGAPLRDLIEKSRDILAAHPVNIARAAAGRKTANSIWPWSGGPAPAMPTYAEKFGLTGAAVSAVDLVQGLGTLAGLDVIRVPGATGMVDTNYTGKVQAAISALAKSDFVLIHLEGTDEASHMGELDLKMEGIRRFDSLVVAPLLEAIKSYDDYLAIVLPDHPTPMRIRTHSCDPVPFAAISSRGFSTPASGLSYSERNAATTGINIRDGHSLLAMLLDDAF